ncbi:Doublesex-and mab-3-related transcription factor 3 [Aphelenchoides besseyi]|nr:Doublesex-and mab-3-related transcription factor 3 [Aphelenchoides besseyi]KAI6186081.1 Doublesex-and mab-3-related transcription factor 3 [Aphelenchoides besseyi]
MSPQILQPPALDVKRFCGICRQHGVLEETRGHVCSFKDCQCNKCDLVRTRRLIMSQQIRLRRAQDRRFQRTNEPTQADVFPTGDKELFLDAKSMCYFCQKCKNHEILVWKKQHKRQCPFTNCPCEKCELIETRRRLDQHIKKRKYSPIDVSLDNERSGSHSTKSFGLSSPDESASPYSQVGNENQFTTQSPHFSPPVSDTNSQESIQTVCIPIYIPVLTNSTTSIEATQLSTSELLQRAAAQHFAASQLSFLPDQTFHLVPDSQPNVDPLLNQLLCNPYFDINKLLSYS